MTTAPTSGTGWYIDGMKSRLRGYEPDGSETAYSGVMKSVEVDEEDRRVYGTISTPRMDMEREVILPDFDTSYFPDVHKTVFYCHQYDQLPVGKCVNSESRRSGLYAVTYITEGGIGNDVLTMLREGVINGFSVGTKRIDFGKPTPEEVRKHGACDIITRRSKLLEYSVTPTPMNPDCYQTVQDMVASKAIKVSSALFCFGDVTPLSRGQKVDSALPIMVDEEGTPWAIRFG